MPDSDPPIPPSTALVIHDAELVDDALALPGAIEPLSRNPAAVFLGNYKDGPSRRTMKYALGVLTKMLGQDDMLFVPWASLTYAHTQLLRTKLAESFAPASANLVLVALKGVLKETWRLGLISHEDFARATDLKPVKGHREPAGRSLPAGELRALFTSCDTTTALGARDAAMLGLMYGAGLRRADVVNATLENYDVTQAELKVIRKGSREQLVPLPNGASDAVAHWLKFRGDVNGPLVCGVLKDGRVRVGRRLSTDAVYDAVARAYTKAGVLKFSPHDLRRSFMGDLMDAGVDMVSIQKLAGHASPTTTSKYDRRPHATRRKAVQSIHVPFVALEKKP